MREKMSNNTSLDQIKTIRKYLKFKIIEDNVSFRGHDSERSHVFDLMKRVVLHGESHSALIIGPRGSGKTTLVNSVLTQLSQEVDLETSTTVVKLNGLIHHDEKVAFRSITAQMGIECSNLEALLHCIGGEGRLRSALFILEELDMFCHSGRTQMLLYHLFDMTHSGRAPVCVIGVTNRIDLMELLEKRVKSRFSHRHILVFPSASCVELMVGLLSVPVKGRRKGRKKSIVASEDMETDQDQTYSIPQEVLLRCKVDPTQFQALDPSFVEDWNAHIRGLAENDKVVDSIEKFCYYTVNEQIFRNVLFQLVSKLSPSKPYIDPSDLSQAIDNTVAPEHRVKMLQSLSILELSLVIAMMHGMEIFDGQPMNFEMVLHRILLGLPRFCSASGMFADTRTDYFYAIMRKKVISLMVRLRGSDKRILKMIAERYTKFANANSSTQTVPRPVILKAFEHLQELEIIVPIRNEGTSDSTANRVQKEYKLYTLAVPLDDIKEAVRTFKALPTEINHWFSNSVF